MVEVRIITGTLWLAPIAAVVVGIGGCANGGRSPRSTGKAHAPRTTPVLTAHARQPRRGDAHRAIAPTGHIEGTAGPVGAAACPSRAPKRSSPAGAGSPIAPGDPVWTTVCIYRPHGLSGVHSAQRYAGGPLDQVLDGTLSAVQAGQSCGGGGLAPMVALLRYRSGAIRRIVIDFGRCTVVRSDGSQAHLPTSAWGPLSQYYAG